MAIAPSPYPDVVAVELLVPEGGPADVLVVEPPPLGLAHVAWHVVGEVCCLPFFFGLGLRKNWRETGKVNISVLKKLEVHQGIPVLGSTILSIKN